MFTRTDKKSMILQALLVAPELMEIVLEGLSEFSDLDPKSREFVQECVDKVNEIRNQRNSSNVPEHTLITTAIEVIVE